MADNDRFDGYEDTCAGAQERLAREVDNLWREVIRMLRLDEATEWLADWLERRGGT